MPEGVPGLGGPVPTWSGTEATWTPAALDSQSHLPDEASWPLQGVEEGRPEEAGPGKCGERLRPPRSPRWHHSAELVGALSEDGHVFRKAAGPRQKRVRDTGVGYELATICMVFDASLRCAGRHTYRFTLLDGDLGPADGAGFVFDTRVRRRPLHQMRAVFLNQRGTVCLRKGQQVTKLPVQLPRLRQGGCLTLVVDLDRHAAHFCIASKEGSVEGSADVRLEMLLSDYPGGLLRSGFFCAVVTGSGSFSLH